MICVGRVAGCDTNEQFSFASQLGKGHYNFLEVLNDSLVVTCKSQKALNFKHYFGLQPIHDYLNLLCNDQNPISIDNMPQKHHVVKPEFTFFEMVIQPLVLQCLQRYPSMFSVLILIL